MLKKKKVRYFSGFVFEGVLTNEPRSFLKGPKGGFPLSRDFYVCTRVNKIETMYERSRVSVNVEQGSTFTFTRDLPYIVSISFTRVYFTCVRKEKITRQWKSTLSQKCTSNHSIGYSKWVMIRT